MHAREMIEKLKGEGCSQVLTSIRISYRIMKGEPFIDIGGFQMSRVIVPKIDPREEIKDFLGVLVPDEILIPDAETFFYTQEDLYDLVMERPPFLW